MFYSLSGNKSLGNFHGYPFQLLWDPFHHNALGGAMVGVMSAACKGVDGESFSLCKLILYIDNELIFNRTEFYSLIL